MVVTSQGDISEKPCWVEWQIHSAWSLLPWPSPTSRSPEEYGKHVFEESFKLFYIPICSSIIKCWAHSEGVLGILPLHFLQCYCFCSVLSGVCSGLPQNTSASHIAVISFLFQSELSEKSNVASRLSGDFKKCFKSYPSHYPRLVLASRRCAHIGVRLSPVEAQIPVCIWYMDLVSVNTETNNKLDLILQT